MFPHLVVVVSRPIVSVLLPVGVLSYSLMNLRRPDICFSSFLCLLFCFPIRFSFLRFNTFLVSALPPETEPQTFFAVPILLVRSAPQFCLRGVPEVPREVCVGAQRFSRRPFVVVASLHGLRAKVPDVFASLGFT